MLDENFRVSKKMGLAEMKGIVRNSMSTLL